MKTYEPQELKNILELHRKWVVRESGGERADLSSANLSYADLSSANLSYANLRYADLSYADLSYANLRSADLSYANLRYADLSSADLSYANLRYADLSYADLSDIVEDLYKVLDLAKLEVQGLYKSIWDGKIDGSHYEGDCACLVGTIANIKHVRYDTIEGLSPNADRLSERWFLGIKEGDMPQNSAVSKLTAEWMEKYMKREGIPIPKRTVVWS